MRTIRFHIGRALIHAGLAIMPPGRAKAELYELYWSWGEEVRRIVADRQPIH